MIGGGHDENKTNFDKCPGSVLRVVPDHDKLSAELSARVLSSIYSDEPEAAREHIKSLSTVQLADFLTTSSFKTHRKFFSIMGSDIEPEVLSYLDAEVLNNVIQILGNVTFANLVAKLDSHDLMEILRSLELADRLGIIALLPDDYRDLIKEFLSYPEYSAGRLINDRVITIPSHWNVGMAMDFLRHYKDIPDNFYHIFIVDSRMLVVGQLYVSKLLQLQRHIAIADIMDRDVTTISAKMDQEEVAYIFRKYALANAPVVDDDGKIVGAISIEDIAGVINEEISEDIAQIGGLATSGNINTRISRSILNRIPWLLTNVFLSSLISYAVGCFADTINSIVALAVLLPVITSIGGCSASQAVSGTIRALAFREITKNNLARITIKEMTVALSLGLILGTVSGAIVLFRYNDIGLCAVYISAVIGTFIVSSCIGLLGPVFLQRIKLDPAVVSPVIVSAASDAFAYCFFLAMATIILL